MTNEEKAREIAKEKSQSYGFGLNCDSSIECYESALKMAEWKDEQFRNDMRIVFEQAVNIGKHQMKRRIQSSIDVMELLMKNEEVENSERFDFVVMFIDSLKKELETL